MLHTSVDGNSTVSAGFSPSSIVFGNDQHLCQRLLDAKDMTEEKKEYIFLVGSALTMPKHDNIGLDQGDNRESYGVPGSKGMVSLISELLKDDKHLATCQAQVAMDLSGSLAEQYTSAFMHILNCQGPEGAKQVLQKAVLRAWRTGDGSANNKFNCEDFACNHANEKDFFQTMETQLHKWRLPVGTEALGNIISEFPEKFGRYLLTTNFDPLLPIAVRRARYRAVQTSMIFDGNPSQTLVTGCHVIHLHGYWYTHGLHTPIQLSHSRPILLNFLKHLIRRHPIIVMGYSGWDDVFTEAVRQVIVNQEIHPSIIWCFYENEDTIIKNYSDLLVRLEHGFSLGRVQYYQGIDCNRFLPQLLDNLRGQSCPKIQSSLRSGKKSEHEHEQRLDLIATGAWILISTHGVRAFIKFTKDAKASSGRDGLYSIRRLFVRDEFAFFVGKCRTIAEDAGEWKLDRGTGDLILYLNGEEYKLRIPEPLSAPVHWCYEDGNTAKADSQIPDDEEKENKKDWKGFWERHWNKVLPLPAEKLKDPSADFVIIHVFPWPNLDGDLKNEFCRENVQEGYWVKMAEFGGNYLVKLGDDGMLVERHLFDRWKTAKGFWWLNEQRNPDANLSERLNIWISEWKLEVLNDHRLANPVQNEDGCFEFCEKSIDQPRTPEELKSKGFDSSGLLFPCIEHDPHRDRNTRFYVAHLFPAYLPPETNKSG